MHAWQTCRSPNAAMRQRWQHSPLTPSYGTGVHGSLRPAGLAACALMNRQRESGAFVLAVDLPSGINTDTGEAAEGAVRADLTVTFDSCKPLHTAPSSAPFCGEIVCADIGIRDEWHPEF